MATALADQRGATTPWATGRFDQRGGRPRLLFGRTFEDPSIEQSLFPDRGTVLCITSAGDTARALASPARKVIAVDINAAQVTEVQRRLSGHVPRSGSADRLLALGRAALLPVGWTPARLRAFCQLADAAEQTRQWAALASPRVRAVLGALLSRRLLRVAYGPDFAGLLPGRFGDVVLDRIGARVAQAPNRDNPWLAQLLTGHWPAVDRVVDPALIDLRTGDVAEVLERLAPGSLAGISLSNVLDGPGSAYADRLLGAATRAARPGAPIVVRSFLDTGDREARRLAARDRSLLWGAITVLSA